MAFALKAIVVLNTKECGAENNVSLMRFTNSTDTEDRGINLKSYGQVASLMICKKCKEM